METNNLNSAEEPIENDTEFENADVDPGFVGHQDDDEAEGGEEESEDALDAKLNAAQRREEEENGDNDEGTDALNYKNDRENGSYNPKNI